MTRLADKDLLARVLAKACEYLDQPAVVGHETTFLDHLVRDYAACGFTVERPQKLCVVDLGKPGPVFLAHADRPGAILTKDGEAVYAAHALESHDHDAHPLDGDALKALSVRLSGSEVFAYDPASGGRVAYGAVTGVSPDQQRRALLSVSGLPPLKAGTPLAFARALDSSQTGFITGQLENAAPLAALRIAAELGLGGKIIVTCEADLGHSMEHVLDWAQTGGLEPTSELIVCDTTRFEDGAASLAGAVVLRRRDAASSFNADQVSRLESAASAAGAPIIFKDSFIERENDARSRRGEALKSMGHTELGQITAASKGRYSGATLQLPTFVDRDQRQSTTPRALTAFTRTLTAL